MTSGVTTALTVTNTSKAQSKVPVRACPGCGNTKLTQNVTIDFNTQEVLEYNECAYCPNCCEAFEDGDLAVVR